MSLLEHVGLILLHFYHIRYCRPDDDARCMFLIKIVGIVQQDSVIYLHVFETSERQVNKSVKVNAFM